MIFGTPRKRWYFGVCDALWSCLEFLFGPEWPKAPAGRREYQQD